MYETKYSPLLPRAKFHRRMVAHGGVALSFIGFSLLTGVLGYHLIADIAWIDSLLNASMILGGMGPIDRLNSTSAKLFASVYALYSGLVLLVSVGILSAPVFHRILHHLHIQTEREK